MASWTPRIGIVPMTLPDDVVRPVDGLRRRAFRTGSAAIRVVRRARPSRRRRRRGVGVAGAADSGRDRVDQDGDRVRGYLGDESDFVFLGAFLMTGLLFVAGGDGCHRHLAVAGRTAGRSWSARCRSVRWRRRAPRPGSVRRWRDGATARSTSRRRPSRPSIGCSTRTRRRRCSSATARCRSRHR